MDTLCCLVANIKVTDPKKAAQPGTFAHWLYPKKPQQEKKKSQGQRNLVWLSKFREGG